MGIVWHKTVLEEIVPVTDILWRFYFRVEQMPVFAFEAGQFITLDLPIGQSPKERWRSYSIASAPGKTNLVELLIVHKYGGHGTDFLFDEARPGDVYSFRGPAGKFVLPDIIDTDLVMICTGTGVAPFRSMIQDIIANNKSHRDIHLVFGSRYAKDAVYKDEFEHLPNSHSWFHYHLALSREDNPFAGHKGYIHPLYEKLVPQLPDAIYYLCGWKVIMDEVKQKLAGLGVARSNIHFENYG